MCWNYAVSLTFSVLYLIINSYNIIAKPKYWREYFFVWNVLFYYGIISNYAMDLWQS